MKAKKASEAHKLEDIPNVAKTVAADLRLMGITKPSQ